ncbi:lipoprotein insertase outer membrane protein LolB [Paucibacter sp. APW11]|uniref:Outer-membrane lipoprotein LolB n=1 Tax=Roseateles aquae TaxID=3077235 RepID=A0ABU3PCA9_9BURK|nr:lipoprotein insertase outer membrane protein LolB [Paucibacter sp. APW11]MDT9000212.1 lipoprotein insertase outer membrane protein LolB [Paucibacter sp. APW11]
MSAGGFRCLAVALAALMLSACASLKPAAPQSEVVNASSEHLTGRISVQVPATLSSKAQGGAASFELWGTAERGQLELSSPLGSLIARARWQPGEVLLQVPGEDRQYDTLDSLTQGLLGEAIPVAALFDWLAGRAWPGAAAVPLPQQGFEQLGWRVDTSLLGEGLIKAVKLGEPATSLRIKLQSSP